MIYKVTLNEKVYTVEVEKGDAILLDVSSAPVSTAQPPVAPAATSAVAAPVVPATAAPAAIAGGEVIPAPLPGTVLDMKVATGQAVTKGQVLLIIEAMKMENEIFAPRDGVVAQVVCEKGSSVNTGEPLVVLA